MSTGERGSRRTVDPTDNSTHIHSPPSQTPSTGNLNSGIRETQKAIRLTISDYDEAGEAQKDFFGLESPGHGHEKDNPFEVFFKKPDSETFALLLHHLVNLDLDTGTIVDNITVFSKKCVFITKDSCEEAVWNLVRGDNLWSFGANFHFLERRLYHRISRLRRSRHKQAVAPDSQLSTLFFTTNLGWNIFHSSRNLQKGFTEIFDGIMDRSVHQGQNKWKFKDAIFEKQTLIDYIILASDQNSAPYRFYEDNSIGKPAPAEHLTTPTYYDDFNGFREVTYIWQVTDTKCDILIHPKFAYEEFVDLILKPRTEDSNKALQNECFLAFLGILHELVYKHRYSAYYVATHIIRHCTVCNCTTNGTTFRKGLSFLKFHIPEIKVWSYTLELIIAREQQCQTFIHDRPDMFKFGWARHIWILYNEHSYTIQDLVDLYISKCKRDLEAPKYILFFRNIRFSVDYLIQYILDIVKRESKPIELDTIKPELSFVVKHVWVNAPPNEQTKNCRYCGISGGSMVTCTTCDIVTHRHNDSLSISSSDNKCCAQMLDESADETCVGPESDPYNMVWSDRVTEWYNSSLRIRKMDNIIHNQPHVASTITLVPPPAPDTNQAVVTLEVKEVKAHFKSLLQSTFNEVIQRETIKVDRDIKSLELNLSKATLHGNIHGVNTSLLDSLPISYSQSPELQALVKETTAEFYTSLRNKVERLTNNLVQVRNEKRIALPFEVFVSVVTELLSSAYHDKLVKEKAEFCPSFSFIKKPLKTMKYKDDTEALLCKLNTWATELIRNTLRSPNPFTADTAVKVKNAVNHQRHGDEEISMSDKSRMVWSTPSNDGCREIKLPFNRRFVIIYIGLCMSLETKSNIFMQSCWKVLNNEVFYGQYLPPIDDNLWKQVFSLIQPLDNSFEPSYASSLSNLTKKSAKHYLNGEIVKELLDITQGYLRENRKRWQVEGNQELNELFHQTNIQPTALINVQPFDTRQAQPIAQFTGLLQAQHITQPAATPQPQLTGQLAATPQVQHSGQAQPIAQSIGILQVRRIAQPVATPQPQLTVQLAATPQVQHTSQQLIQPVATPPEALIERANLDINLDSQNHSDLSANKSSVVSMLKEATGGPTSIINIPTKSAKRRARQKRGRESSSTVNTGNITLTKEAERTIYSQPSLNNTGGSLN
jgi:hypothetical protein